MAEAAAGKNLCKSVPGFFRKHRVRRRSALRAAMTGVIGSRARQRRSGGADSTTGNHCERPLPRRKLCKA
jgi:hypothetical protein